MGGLGDREHLGMGGGVLEQFHLVVGAGDDPVLAHNHGANRYLVGFEGDPGLAQGFLHEMIVAGEVDRRSRLVVGLNHLPDASGSDTIRQVSSDAQNMIEVVDLAAVRRRLRVTGDDRVQFLHGQCTNDIKRLAAGEACYAAFLTAKGKMRGDAEIICRADAFLLSTEAAQGGGLREILEKYIITEDVEIADVTDETFEWAVWGEAPAAETACYPNRLGGWNVWGARERFDALVAAGAMVVSAEDLETRRIEAGVPRYGIDMDETTIPIEAGLAGWAISYDKGCYIGQETIARIKTYGHVNRHLVQLAAAEVPQRGAVIRSGDREIGRVTSATRSPALGKALVLGYVRREFAETGVSVTIGNDTAEVIQLCGN